MTAIIPAYNCAEFVGQAIESVLAQTYPALDCVVVDDGSTDNTAGIVKRYGDRVELIQQANQGVAAARNRGAKEARGELLAFLDADDMWLPEKTEIQVEARAHHPDAGLIYGAYHVVDPNLNHIRTVDPPRSEVAVRNTVLLQAPGINLVPTGMVPTALFRRIGGFDVRLSTSADLDLTLRIVASHQAVSVAEPVALYRQREGQMSSDISLMERDMLLVLSKFFESQTIPSTLFRLRRRSYANLFLILAASYVRQGRPVRGFHRALRAATWSPSRTASVVSRRIAQSLISKRRQGATHHQNDSVDMSDHE